MRFTTDYQVDFENRDPDSATDEQFYRRWSPRSFKKVQIPESDLATILDAARWSPSSFNEQPWLFVTASDENEFARYLDLLIDKNKVWARNASLIGFIFAKRDFAKNGEPNRFHFFDCGAAWMAMALQAQKLGLYTHALGGIKRDSVAPALRVPEETFEVVCGFVIGAIDDPGSLPPDLAAKEVPTSRKPLSQIWSKGRY